MTDPVPPTDPADPTAERARIEPASTGKRLDALPILYLAGFLILAGSLIYIWRHPTLPSGVTQQAARVDTLQQQADARAQELAALQDRLTRLEQRPAPTPPTPPPPVDLAPLQAQLKALDDKSATTADLGPLEAQVKALQDRAPPDLGPLEARLKTLEDKPAPPPPADLGPLTSRLAALEARKPADLKPVEDKLAALDARLADLAKTQTDAGPKLSNVEAQAKATADKLDGIAGKVLRSQRVIAATAALEAGQKLGDIPGAPQAVTRFAQQAPPTEASLRLSFDKAAEAAHRASQPALTDDQPLLGRMWTRAQQSVTVRQGDRVLVGDPIAGVLAAAREKIEAGDLAGTVKALAGLSGPARAAMQDWIDRAQSVLDARAALAEMAAG